MDSFLQHCLLDIVDDDNQITETIENQYEAKEIGRILVTEGEKLAVDKLTNSSAYAISHNQLLDSLDAELNSMIREHFAFLQQFSTETSPQTQGNFADSKSRIRMSNSPYPDTVEPIELRGVPTIGELYHFPSAEGGESIIQETFITKGKEISKKECLNTMLGGLLLSKRAKVEISKSELQDTFSKVYFEVNKTFIDPEITSNCCQKIYESEFPTSDSSNSGDVERSEGEGEVIQKDKKSVWIPSSISKAIGQEKLNLNTNSHSLCGMINFRNKGAWKRAPAAEAQARKSIPFPENR